MPLKYFEYSISQCAYEPMYVINFFVLVVVVVGGDFDAANTAQK